MDTQEFLPYHKNSMSDVAPAIEIRDLRKHYGGKAAVDLELGYEVRV